jgi:hypothetical protein
MIVITTTVMLVLVCMFMIVRTFVRMLMLVFMIMRARRTVHVNFLNLVRMFMLMVVSMAAIVIV